jgi:hypothetical protein
MESELNNQPPGVGANQKDTGCVVNNENKTAKKLGKI